MDLECSDGGTGQYGCSNMGISALCGDIYGSGLSCQWIDVTDVADGTYFLIVRANWDFIPDALGETRQITQIIMLRFVSIWTEVWGSLREYLR